LQSLFFEKSIDQRPVQCNQNSKSMNEPDTNEYGYRIEASCKPPDIYIPFLEKSITRY